MNNIPPVNKQFVFYGVVWIDYYYYVPYLGRLYATGGETFSNVSIGDLVTLNPYFNGVDYWYPPSNILVTGKGFDSTENCFYLTLNQNIDFGESVQQLVLITSATQASTNIRYADFVRLTTRNRYTAPFTIGQEYTILSLGTTDFTSIGASSNTVGVTFTATGAGSGTGVATQPQVYLFSTAPSAITVSAVDSQPFNGLGQLVQIGAATRDIKSTANETSFTLIGIDTSMLSLVLGTDIKGSMIEAWHGFFDSTGAFITTGGTGGLYKFFTGYINTFSITEQWMEEIRAYVGAVAVNASSIQIIMRNRVAGRYTNDASWQFFTPNDNSMARVAFISNINYQFGKNT